MQPCKSNDTYSPPLYCHHFVNSFGAEVKEYIRKRFGKRVRKLCKEAGYSQDGFAHECGLDRTYIGGIERGERNGSLANIEKISVAPGIPISKLFNDL